MKVYIKNINVWLAGLDDPKSIEQWANNKLELPSEFTLPKPSYYPKAQLRRLSPFSKVILHCLDIPQALTENLPLVFASRHGDLAKTVQLIKGAALGEELSPTQFTLSVHNATTGLFGIATNNRAPTTTISAGDNTFVEGLVEAMMQCQQEKTDVIYSYCDFDVPEEYHQFEKRQPARCITMVLSEKACNDNLATVQINMNEETSKLSVELSEVTELSEASIDFIRDFYLAENSVIQSKNYSVLLGFH